MKALHTLQIQKSLKSDEFSKTIFKAVLPRDKLPNSVTFPSAYVINTHPSDKQGEHWLALHFDQNGNCSFFDSLGFEPKFKLFYFEN